MKFVDGLSNRICMLVAASRPLQLHLKGRGSEDEVVDAAFHTSNRFRGLRDGFSPSTASRQRSPPATL